MNPGSRAQPVVQIPPSLSLAQPRLVAGPLTRRASHPGVRRGGPVGQPRMLTRGVPVA